VLLKVLLLVEERAHISPNEGETRGTHLFARERFGMTRGSTERAFEVLLLVEERSHISPKEGEIWGTHLFARERFCCCLEHRWDWKCWLR
jgi:hypothetical protein